MVATLIKVKGCNWEGKILPCCWYAGWAAVGCTLGRSERGLLGRRFRLQIVAIIGDGVHSGSQSVGWARFRWLGAPDSRPSDVSTLYTVFKN